ncbi:MAG: DUF4249 domain-containing protein, partial [Dysgonamonadaceae bacterium]|nr:DUF4249 domain-containing protein [Dysgonamonadaceae bacterium]
FRQIDDAEVTFRKDGSPAESLQNVGEGYYIGTYVPREGDNLRITASCNGFDPVECETQMVSPTPVISVDTMNTRMEKSFFYNYGYDENGYLVPFDSTEYLQFESDMTVTFEDPANIANYYAMELNLHVCYSSGEVFDKVIGYTSDDMVFRTNDLISFNNGNSQLLYPFSDELFDGKKYSLKIKAASNYWNYDFPGYWNYDFPAGKDYSKITGQEIQVTLRSLSPSYYLYLKTRGATNSAPDFFMEPVQIYTNIKGGIGIFGNYSNATYGIPLN